MNEELNIKFTPQGLDYTWKVLARQPWGEVDPLMQSIKSQVSAQQHDQAQALLNAQMQKAPEGAQSAAENPQGASETAPAQ